MACAWAAWILPIVLALRAPAGRPGWGEDIAALRDIAFQPVGSEGALSTILCQLALLAPVGDRMLRASLVGVMALAAASGLLFALIRRVLQRESSGRLDPVWALLGTQLWAASAAVRAESERLGGSMLGLALLLVGVRALDELRADPRTPALAGAIVALTAAEHHYAGLTLATACALLWGAGGLPQRGARARAARDFVAAAASVVFVLGGFRGLRAVSPHVRVDLGLGVEVSVWPPAPGPAELGVLQLLERVAGGWRDRLGTAALALALVGALWALPRASLRRELRVVWTLVPLGVAGPISSVLGSAGGEVFFGLSSALGLASLAPLALRALMTWLWTCGLPMARAVAVLSSAVAMALVLSRVDASREVPQPLGLEVWTEEALGQLPPRAVLLVNHPVLTTRLVTAQLLDGERSDVVVVPAGLLGGDPLIRRLRDSHPEVAPLLRQLAVSGFPDEYALSQLADARPVLVELDRRWSLRLQEHLRPQGLWLELAPHAQASLARRAGARDSLRVFWRALSALRHDDALDPGTAAAFAELAGHQVLALAALGDLSEARTLLAARAAWAGRDAFARELAARLRQTRRGRVVVDDLTN